MLAARRASPQQSQFLALLSNDCEPDVAAFLWDELAVYWHPITPHPDDDFLMDLSIDHDEPEDWLFRFCKMNRLNIVEVQPWQPDWPTTVRQLARWLSEERLRQTAK